MSTTDKDASSSKDYTYLNLQLINTTTSDIPATYNETRLRPILDDMESYTMSVIRMKVPSSSIPLFEFEDGEYVIGFTLGAGNTNPIPPRVVGYNSRPVTADPNNRNVFYYNQFLDDVNAELYLLWQDALANPAYAVDGVIPASLRPALVPPPGLNHLLHHILNYQEIRIL